MPLAIDADFPGGNIVVESIDGDVVRLHQDIRTTSEWWFYWMFCIRGAAGRTVRFTFTNKDVFTAQGPCFSADGLNWQWLGRQTVTENGFSFSFPAAMNEAFFSVGVPYVQRDLDVFLSSRGFIQRSMLTITEHGRKAEKLLLQSELGRQVVVLSARTHACEAMASFALEGILDFWAADRSPEGEFLREQVDLLVFPFVDKDGVEAGDQGKLRAPHDHNRDFLPQPLYATTRAIQAELQRVAGRIRLGIDLHCPWIRGRRNEDVYIVGPQPPWDRKAAAFARVLEASRQGELPCPADKLLPHGVDWNTLADAPTLARYVSTIDPNCELGVSLEIPYAVAGGVTVTADRARGLGRDIGRAIARFLAAPAII